MIEETTGRQLLSLHYGAWEAIRGLLRERGISPAWDARLLYGWRSRLHSLAWRLQPRPRPADDIMPIGLLVCGFWRSGTTLLHECLARDPRWRAPTTQECMNPGQAPSSAGRVMRRPMDHLVIAADSPQEDEFALLLLGAPSFYRALLCPGAWRGLLTELAAGAEHGSWPRREALLRDFCAWLCARDRRALLLKSPTHSFALARLLEAAPQARAVIILRDWRAVWPSCLRMWSAMFALYALEPWKPGDVAEMTLAAMLEYARALPPQLQRIDPARVALIQYEDLAAAPVATLRRVYDYFGLSMADGCADAISNFVTATRPASASGQEPLALLAPSALEELRAADDRLQAATRALRLAPAR
jgi:hypothetical protein